MLMMLAIISYSRLQTFLSFTVIESEYRHYMTTIQREHYNQAQQKMYKNLEGSPDDSIGEEGEDEEQEQGDSRKEEKEKKPPQKRLNASINFDPFIKKEAKDKSPEQLKKVEELLRRLLKVLYADKSFFREMQEKHPGFIDQLLNRLIEIADTEVYRDTLKEKADIATIDLKDPDLQDVYYKMLHGTRKKTHKKNEFLIDEGYLSLLDFIKINEKSQGISIYLAPGELLMAIYDNEELVKEVISSREKLYSDMKYRGLAKEQAAQIFKGAFEGKSYLGKDENGLIDFSVSLSNPRGYR